MIAVYVAAMAAIVAAPLLLAANEYAQTRPQPYTGRRRKPEPPLTARATLPARKFLAAATAAQILRYQLATQNGTS
jgi:hypothetical protein